MDTKKNNNKEVQLRKLFVGGLPQATEKTNLEEYFKKFGPIEDINIMKDPTTGNSRGFGFITFDSEERVNQVQAARPHSILGKNVDTKRAVPREEQIQGSSSTLIDKIFCGKLSDTITNEDLSTYFSEYGEVESAEIGMDKETNKPRGFAFVKFKDPDQVDRVILHKPHTIKGTAVDVKKAVPKNDPRNPSKRRGQAGFGWNGPEMGFGGGYGMHPYPPGGYHPYGGYYPPPGAEMGGYYGGEFGGEFGADPYYGGGYGGFPGGRGGKRKAPGGGRGGSNGSNGGAGRGKQSKVESNEPGQAEATPQ